MHQYSFRPPTQSPGYVHGQAPPTGGSRGHAGSSVSAGLNQKPPWSLLPPPPSSFSGEASLPSSTHSPYYGAKNELGHTSSKQAPAAVSSTLLRDIPSRGYDLATAPSQSTPRGLPLQSRFPSQYSKQPTYNQSSAGRQSPTYGQDSTSSTSGRLGFPGKPESLPSQPASASSSYARSSESSQHFPRQPDPGYRDVDRSYHDAPSRFTERDRELRRSDESLTYSNSAHDRQQRKDVWPSWDRDSSSSFAATSSDREREPLYANDLSVEAQFPDRYRERESNSDAVRRSLVQKLTSGAGDQVGLSAAQISEVVEVVKFLQGKKEDDQVREREGERQYFQQPPVPQRASLPREHPGLVFKKSDPPPLVPVPSHLLDKIQDDEYVNFCDLLYNNMHSPAEVKLAEEEVQSSSGSLDMLAPSGLTAIRGLLPWMLAWSRYLRTRIAVDPQSALEMIRYQCFILEMSTRYTFPAWLSYDSAFRQVKSQVPERRWDEADPELCRIWFTEARRVQPATPGATLQPMPQTVSAVPIAGPNNEYMGVQLCKNFNLHRCANRSCTFAHLCSFCLGSHPLTQCRDELAKPFLLRQLEISNRAKAGR